MELDLKQKFLLLALDQTKGRFLIDTLSLNYGIIGALLLELSEKEKLTIKHKKLVVINSNLTKDDVLDECLNLIIKSKKNRRVKFWINKIANRANRFKRNILQDLKHKNLINIQKRTYMWGLIKVYRYPVLNTKLVNDIKQKLKNVVLKNEKADLESVLFLSLMHSSKLSRILFLNKKEYRNANKRIKELTKEIEISEAVSDALKEVQAAVMIATTSAFVGASAAS